MGLLGRERRRLPVVGEEGPRRLAICAGGLHRYEFLLRVTQGRELPAEDAAGVDVDRPVQPLRLGDRRVAVDDHRLAPVLGRPVLAHRQTELIRLAGGLAVQREVAHLGGSAPLHLLLHPGVGHDQFAAIEDVVTHQAIEEVRQRLAERLARLGRQRLDLRERVGQAVRDLHVLAPELPQQLHVVVAGDAQGRAAVDHVAHQPHGVEDAGAAVHQIADEYGLTALRMGEIAIAPQGIGVPQPDRRVAEPPEQLLQLVATAVNVADDVKGAAFPGSIVPQGHALDDGGFHLFRRLQHENVTEALAAESPERPAQLGLLLADDVGTEVAIVALAVAVLAEPFRQIQHDGDRQAVVTPSQFDERLAGLGLHIGGVDHRQPAQRQPLGGDVVQHFEGVVGDGLVVRVVSHHRPAGVRRQDFGGQEVLAREGALASAAGADEDDNAEFGDRYYHHSTRKREDAGLKAHAAAVGPADRAAPHSPEEIPAANSPRTPPEARRAALVLAPVKVEVHLDENGLLRAGQLPADEVVEVRQPGRLVQAKEIGFDRARLHQANARQQDAVDVQQRLDARRILLRKQLPLRLREAQVVVDMVARDAAGGDLFQLAMFRRRVDDQRREHLLQHIAVLPQQQAEELPSVVRHQVDLQPVVDSRLLDGLRAGFEANHLMERQQMDAAQVEIRVRRGEAVQVRPADRGEDQRVRVLFNLLFQQGDRNHGNSSAKASRRARTRKALARS